MARESSQPRPTQSERDQARRRVEEARQMARQRERTENQTRYVAYVNAH